MTLDRVLGVGDKFLPTSLESYNITSKKELYTQVKLPTSFGSQKKLEFEKHLLLIH